ncbi:unnamed protein product [Peniophora sp. CBMAI 1063]|nr:unnamed protein product [Peniophora sp. CBMAI 1063]
MDTRCLTRLDSAHTPAPAPTAENDAFDGELSELSESDVEMDPEAQEEEDGAEERSRPEGDEDGKLSEDERPTKRRKTTGGSSRITRTRTLSTTTATKKKTTSAPKRKPAARSRARGSRSKNIMSLPLDVMLEVFTALQPSDLLALARTSKALRRMMMNRAHVDVWKAARANVPGIAVPEPHNGVSEPAWAHLLYGGSACCSCGTKNVQRVDFGLQKRLCTACKKRSLVWSSHVAKLGMDPALMDLVGYTNVGGYSHGYAANSRFYWKQDLFDMERKLAEMRRGPGGMTAIRNFRAQRIAQVDTWMKAVKALDESMQQSNYDSVVSRLTDAGYEKQDMPLLSSLTALISTKQELTDAAWKRLRPKIEPKVIGYRDRRLALEDMRRPGRRSRKAAWLYRDFLHTLVPVQWRFLPTPQHIIDSQCRELPSFKALVDMKKEPDQQAWDDAVSKLPMELSAHLILQLAILKQALPDLSDTPDNFTFALASAGSDAFVLDAISARFASLDLARSVFIRGERDWTTGCDNPHAWDMMSLSNGTGKPKLIPRGSAAVRAVAQLAGKTFATVTATELDVACGDTWFLCGRCVQNANKDCVAYKGWRGFVDHCVRTTTTGSDIHQPVVFPTKTGTGEFKRTNAPGHRYWACTHCAEYCVKLSPYARSFITFEHGVMVHSSAMETFVSDGKAEFAFGGRDDLILHNKTKHEIQDPIEHVDYFYYALPGATRPVTWANVPRQKPQPQPQAKVAPVPNAAPMSRFGTVPTTKTPVTGGFNCMHCAKPGQIGRARVFTVEDGVRSHIMAKHMDAVGTKTKQMLVLKTDFIAAS